MIYLLLYLLGYIVAYYLCKQMRESDNNNTWEDVAVSFKISFFSWLLVFIIIILIILYDKKDSEPPSGL